VSKKICVVGGGRWGKNHISTLHKLGALAGIVDTSKSLFSDFSKHYPGVKTYLNIDDALIDDFDGFTVATPAESHYAIAEKIIQNKNHVLIEKPMTLCVNDAEKLVQLAIKNKINLMVGHVLLFHPAIKKIKEIIDNKGIGDLQYIYSNRLNLGKVRSEENVFWSLAPHDIAILQYLIGSNPISINAHGSTFLQEGIYDSTMTHLSYKNGVQSHIFVSWLHPFKEHRLVVIGSEAMLTFEDSKTGNPLKLYSKKIDLSNGAPKKIDGPIELITYEKILPLTAELKHFINYCSDKKNTFADGEHGLEVIKILVESSKKLFAE